MAVQKVDICSTSNEARVQGPETGQGWSLEVCRTHAVALRCIQDNFLRQKPLTISPGAPGKPCLPGSPGGPILPGGPRSPPFPVLPGRPWKVCVISGWPNLNGTMKSDTRWCYLGSWFACRSLRTGHLARLTLSRLGSWLGEASYLFIIVFTYWQFVTSFSFHRVWIAGHDHPLQVNCLGCLAVHHLADQDLPVQVDPLRMITSNLWQLTCCRPTAVAPLRQARS